MLRLTETEKQPDAIHPFRIEVPEAALEDLRERLARTRWPDQLPGVGASYGAPLPWVQELAAYWRTGYDWRAAEARLNARPQFTTTIDGQRIHFVHVRSPEPGAMPLLLTHGWPSSFADYEGMIDRLTDPRRHGGDPADAFHLVIPSIPGYGFSGPTTEPGWDSARIARAWHQLMRRLGYDRYGAHGHDAGAGITRELGILQPGGLAGVHMLQIFAFPTGAPGEMEKLTPFEMEGMKILADFESRAGFRAIQSTRPQTLAYALVDSPAGLLAWNSELYTNFGTTELAVDRDLFLTQVTLYWLTATSGSSARIYFEDARSNAGYREVPNPTPTGVAVFPHDFRSVRSFAERANNVVHWSTFDRGGHFAVMECPDLLAADLQTFFRRFR